MRDPVLSFCGVKSRMENTCNVKRKSLLSPVLHKPDGSRLFTEALTTQVKAILADESRLVSTKAALAGSLSKLAGTGKPDCVVSHVLLKATWSIAEALKLVSTCAEW